MGAPNRGHSISSTSNIGSELKKSNVASPLVTAGQRNRYFLPFGSTTFDLPWSLPVMIRLESRLLSVVRAKSTGVGLPELLCTGILATRS